MKKDLNWLSVPALLLSVLLIAFNTKQEAMEERTASDNPVPPKKQKAICCESNIPSRFKTTALSNTILKIPDVEMQKPDAAHAGMVWIPGGVFRMGADNGQASEDEYPKHTVSVNGFWMDATELTNGQFARFVEATGYKTLAERKPDWDELKKQLPPGTAKPDESELVPASLVFSAP
ncbi:MAG: SUMF1/EgtB/PvdO family nonheme iron enzyme, partial [Bacteroidota bacterium]|nr:SUMF1/EgtB/PvdO family nonheme iron enzyme [Bacteroidota bacterium]